MPTAQKFDTLFDIAAALGIMVPEAYREGVAANYERLLEQAALVMATPLPGTTDAVTEFEP